MDHYTKEGGIAFRLNSRRELICELWKKRPDLPPLPDDAKLQICWRLMAIEEKQTRQTFDPYIINQVGAGFQFVDLFRRSASGLYNWQELGKVA